MKLVDFRFVERDVPDEDALPPVRTVRILQVRHRRVYSVADGYGIRHLRCMSGEDWTDWGDVPVVKEGE